MWEARAVLSLRQGSQAMSCLQDQLSSCYKRGNLYVIFRQVGEKVKSFSCICGFSWSLVQNNSYAQVARFGVAYPGTLQRVNAAP